MAYHARGQFLCDGCKVIESDTIELLSDKLRAMPPKNWLHVETTKLNGELHIIASAHFCPACAPLIESYLRGRIPNDVGHA